MIPTNEHDLQELLLRLIHTWNWGLAREGFAMPLDDDHCQSLAGELAEMLLAEPGSEPIAGRVVD